VRRLPSLDGLRGIAAVAVMEFHFAVFFLPQAGLLKIIPHLGRAYLSVDLFFLISGFVMAHVYGKALASNWRVHWRTFAIARFARLYPLFALTILVIVIVLLVSQPPTQLISFSARSLALQPFLLQQWATGLSWNYPSWSISTEVEAYIYFVFFAGPLLLGRNPRLIAVCCGLVVIGLGTINRGSLNYFVGFPALFRTLAEFSLGVLLSRACSSGAGPSHRWCGLFAAFLFAAAIVTKLDFLMVGAFACFIYYSVNATNAVPARFLNSRPLVSLGNWSYSVYLWEAPTHLIVMTIFVVLGHPVLSLSPSSARLLILITSMAVVGIAAIHYTYFEMPIRHLILRLPQQVKLHMPQVRPVLEGRAFFCPHCGALYSATPSLVPKDEGDAAMCVVCLKVMDRLDISKAKSFKLIHRPEDA
jgi:peptidoglycan/LPS O-acetylase OafA/YrhL